MKTSQKLSLFLLLSCGFIVCSIFAQQSPSEELFLTELAKYSTKYSLSPAMQCKQAGCKTLEACLQNVLQAFDFETPDGNEKMIETLLTRDEKELQKFLAEYYFKAYFYQDSHQKYALIKSYLAHQKELRTFLFDENKKYMQGREIISFYKHMPQDPAAICRWIKTEALYNEAFPLQAYKEKSLACLQALHSLTPQDSHIYPNLTHELYQIKQCVQDSLHAIESAYEEEVKRCHEKQCEVEDRSRSERLFLAQQKEIEEKILSYHSVAQAQEAQAQAARNLLYKQEEELERLAQLHKLLDSLHKYQFGVEHQGDVQQILEDLAWRKAQINCSNQSKQRLYNKITALVVRVKQYQDFYDQACCLENIEKDAQKDITKLEKCVARLEQVVASKSEATLPSAPPLEEFYEQPIPSTPPYTGPCVVAVPVVEHERCEKK